MAVDGPERLSRYQLVEKIGEGGMGEVWQAIDPRLGRQVAVKILAEKLARDPTRVARFEREARAVAALNHPNIVTIYSVGEDRGRRFITMELVTGRPLSRSIPSGGLPLKRCFEIAIQLTEAVAAAHARGITHRDLKPGNVMLSEDGRVKVLDFGLAKSGPESGSGREPSTDSLSTDGQVLGTLPYMSPEQLQGRPVDSRTDIFSLAAILYEMATGEAPFQGRTSADLIAAILRDQPPPVDDWVPSLPRQLGRILRHGLQKDPERRFQTVLDLRNELQDLEAELAATKDLPVRGESGNGVFRAEAGSVAVLPLDNLSGDPEQEYFADGMTDALIADLAKIGGLKVISRTSAMQYKGARKPLREIAAALGVGAVVEGSVLRSGRRVRITAQLINAATDRHLWAETYERDLGDILDLQGEVARAIAGKILVKLTPRERSRLGGAGPVNPQAHEAYLRGRYFWHQRTPESVRKGLECFRRAVTADPSYARAWAGIADSYIVDGGRYLSVPPDVAYSRAREAADKAVELDDELAEAHTSLAAVLTDYDWDWTTGEKEFRRAIELNPNYVTARYWFADHLARLGREEESIREAQRALEIDPLSLTTNFMLAWVCFFARRYDDAVNQARKTIELGPRFVPGYRVLGWVHEERGEYDQALAAHSKASELSDGNLDFRAQLGRPHALAGRKDEARKVLAELTARAESESVAALDLATLHAALGDVPSALAWLSRACDQHDDHVPYIKVNPRLDSLRPEPGFQDLLRRVGLAD